MDGKQLIINQDAVGTVAEAAMISGTGARGIRSMLETILVDFMYDMADSRKKKIVIDKDYVEQSLSNILLQRSVKEHTRLSI